MDTDNSGMMDRGMEVGKVGTMGTSVNSVHNKLKKKKSQQLIKD